MNKTYLHECLRHCCSRTTLYVDRTTAVYRICMPNKQSSRQNPCIFILVKHILKFQIYIEKRSNAQFAWSEDQIKNDAIK